MKHSFFVIEDHALTNLGIREILQKNTELLCAGFATTESEAFEKLTELDMKRSLPKLLVLDLFLGNESGIDILHEVNRHFPSVSVLVYSMYSNPGIVNLVLDSGAKGFVSKASDESELIEAANEIYKGNTYIQKSLMEPLHTYTSIFASLTKSEQDVLNKFIERRDIEKVADELALQNHNVEVYLSRICSKTGCKTNNDLIKQFG